MGEAFFFAGRGLLHTWRTQPNLRIHAAAAVGAIMVARWLGLPPAEKSALWLAASLVICVEVLNTAIEAAVNLVTTEFHPLAARAKDVAAAAVLLAAAAAVGVGIIVLGPHARRIFPVLAEVWASSPLEAGAAFAGALLLALSGLRR